MNTELKDIFNNVNDWLKFAEAKHGYIIAFNGAVLAVISQILPTQTLTRWGSYILISCLLASLFLGIGIFISISSFFPRLGNNENAKKLKLKNKIILCFCSFISKFPFFRRLMKAIKNSNIKSQNNNLLYFGDLQHFNSDTLLKSFGLQESENQSYLNLNKDYANQIIVNSQITYKKYRLFKVSAIFTSLGILFVLVCLSIKIFSLIQVA